MNYVVTIGYYTYFGLLVLLYVDLYEGVLFLYFTLSGIFSLFTENDLSVNFLFPLSFVKSAFDP